MQLGFQRDYWECSAVIVDTGYARVERREGEKNSFKEVVRRELPMW
jgi:CRISPR/Cas system-associated endonuclease Cas3-HD